MTLLLNFQGPVVEGGFGRVTGSYWYSQPTARKFAAFLSIPYAQPPIGNLRYSLKDCSKRFIIFSHA
jgi:carboxylesterase type B